VANFRQSTIFGGAQESPNANNLPLFQTRLIKAIGATSLYLFGSTARNEAGEESDLDLFVDYEEDGDFSAIELVRLKN
jgi:predicted nucleotidyltransferase